MTVTTSANKLVAAGNGAQTVFAFSFNNAWDGTAGGSSAAMAAFALLYTDASGNQTAVSRGPGASQFQLALAAPVLPALWGLGGTVTYNPAGTPIAAGTTLTLIRTLPLTQSVSLQNQASFGQYAASAERMGDLLEMQGQQEAELYGRAIVVNGADANPPTPLPPAAQRANHALIFDGSGNPVAGTLPASGVISTAMQPVVDAATIPLALAALGIDAVTGAIYASRTAAAAAAVPADATWLLTMGYAAAGDGGAARYIHGTGATTGGFQSADGQWWKLDLTQSLFGEMFGAVGDGVTDNAAILNGAFVLAAGRELRLGPGTFVVKSQVSYVTNVNYAPGMKLRGAGRGVTIIDSHCGTSAIYSAGGSFAFQLTGWVKDLTITTTAAGEHGVEVLAVFHFVIENVHCTGLAGHGAMISGNLGDPDASDFITFRDYRAEGCGGAGILCNFASTVVQTSFIALYDCFVQECALAGFYWIGLSCTIENCAFAANGGPGLWQVNNAASSAQLTVIGTSFENNGAGGPAVRLDSLEGGQFIDCEIANNNLFAATSGFLVNSASSVRFEGTRVRVAASPYTAFNFAVGATQCTVSNTFWQEYDAAGQVRFADAGSGNRMDDSFDAVQFGDDVGNTSITCANGTNHNVALALSGAVFGIGGPTGAFSIGGFTNGFNGRNLYLENNSGQVLTLISGDAGSAAANRIGTDSGTNVTINNGGNAHFVWAGTWRLFGHG